MIEAEKVKELFDLADKLSRDAKSLSDTIADCSRKGVPSERIEIILSAHNLFRSK